MIRTIYDASPVFVQNWMTSVYGFQLHRLRYGGGFRRYLEEIEKSQWLAPEAMRGLRLSLLRELLVQAHENVEFYRRRFGEAGFDPRRLESESGLRALPPLTREEILRNTESMVSRNVSRRGLRRHFTSGTTSTPLCFYEDKEAVRRNYAFWMRFRSWFGFRPWLRRATLGGRVVVPRGQRKPPFWRYNRAENQIVFSSFHLSDETMPHYIAALRAFAPFVIEGYVSSIFAFARHLNRHGDGSIRPTAVQTTSETLLPSQRREIETAFGCKVFNQYGHGEKAAFISECEQGRLHANDEHGLIEILAGDRPARPGEIGRIVVTGFNNRVMPLIRYDTGDLAVPSAESSCPCGRGLSLVASVEGRVLDILRMPDGKIVPPTALTLLFDKAEAMNVHEAQIVQKSPWLVVVKLVPRSRQAGLDTATLERDLRSMMGQEIEIRFETVDRIPRTQAGKFRFVVSELED